MPASAFGSRKSKPKPSLTRNATGDSTPTCTPSSHKQVVWYSVTDDSSPRVSRCRVRYRRMPAASSPLQGLSYLQPDFRGLPEGFGYVVHVGGAGRLQFRRLHRPIHAEAGRRRLVEPAVSGLRHRVAGHRRGIRRVPSGPQVGREQAESRSKNETRVGARLFLQTCANARFRIGYCNQVLLTALTHADHVSLCSQPRIRWPSHPHRRS